MTINYKNSILDKSLKKYNLHGLPLDKYDFEILDIIPVRAAFLLKTDRGNFALKKVDYNLKKLIFIHSAIEHLIKNGFTRLARTYLTNDGKIYIEKDNEIYTISNWVKGRESDLKNARDMYNASQTLAELHNASMGYDPPENSNPKRNLGKWPKKYLSRCEDLLEFKDKISKKGNINKFDYLFLSNVDYYYEQGLRAFEELQDSDYKKLVDKGIEEKGFCHRDYTYHNLIVDDQEQLHVIDFDYCVIDIPIADISRFFQKVIRKSNWEFDKLKSLLNGYEKVRSLSPEEMRVLYIAMTFPQKFWRLARRYYDQTRNETENELFSKFKDIINERHKREAFLKRFSCFI